MRKDEIINSIHKIRESLRKDSVHIEPKIILRADGLIEVHGVPCMVMPRAVFLALLDHPKLR